MTTQLTDSEFVQAVRDVAAEAPDHVYEKDAISGGCHYVRDGVGSCLIGRALIAAGVPVVVVADLDHRASSNAYVALQGFGLSALVIAWADAAQKAQDGNHVLDGRPWGECVEHADNRIGAPKV